MGRRPLQLGSKKTPKPTERKSIRLSSGKMLDFPADTPNNKIVQALRKADYDGVYQDYIKKWGEEKGNEAYDKYGNWFGRQVNLFSQGVTFGFEDEISSVLAGIGAALVPGGDTYGTKYDKTLAERQQFLDLVRDDSSWGNKLVAELGIPTAIVGNLVVKGGFAGLKKLLKRQASYDETYNYIYRQLKSGKTSTGQKLPEADLTRYAHRIAKRGKDVQSWPNAKDAFRKLDKPNQLAEKAGKTAVLAGAVPVTTTATGAVVGAGRSNPGDRSQGALAGGLLGAKVPAALGGFRNPNVLIEGAQKLGLAHGGAVHKETGGYIGNEGYANYSQQDFVNEAGGGGSFNVTPRQILEFVPVVGDILAAEEVYQEIKKPQPNWLLVGALTGGAIIGLIPGVGDAAAAAIKTGARKGLAGAQKLGKKGKSDPSIEEQLGLDAPEPTLSKQELVTGDKDYTELQMDLPGAPKSLFRIPGKYIKEGDDAAKVLDNYYADSWENRAKARWDVEGRPVFHMGSEALETDQIASLQRVLTDSVHDVTTKGAAGEMDILQREFKGGNDPTVIHGVNPKGSNPQVVAHETGHALDGLLNRVTGHADVTKVATTAAEAEELAAIVGLRRGDLGEIYKPNMTQDELKAGLAKLGRKAIDADYDVEDIVFEGWADFIEQLATSPKNAKILAPGLFLKLKSRVNNDKFIKKFIKLATEKDGMDFKAAVGAMLALGAGATAINSALGFKAVEQA